MEKLNENIIINGNETKYYSNDRLLLTITNLGDNKYVVENEINRLEGFCKKHDNYHTAFRLDKNQFKGKNEKLYNTRKLFNHNEKWFCNILQEKGFVEKTMFIYRQ